MKENAAYNEQFVGECLKKIRKAPDAEEGLNQLLRFLGSGWNATGYMYLKKWTGSISIIPMNGAAAMFHPAYRSFPMWRKRICIPGMSGWRTVKISLNRMWKACKKSDPLIYEFYSARISVPLF